MGHNSVDRRPTRGTSGGPSPTGRGPRTRIPAVQESGRPRADGTEHGGAWGGGGGARPAGLAGHRSAWGPGQALSAVGARAHVRGRWSGRGEAATLPRAGERGVRGGLTSWSSLALIARGAGASRAGGRRWRPRRETRAVAPRPGRPCSAPSAAGGAPFAPQTAVTRTPGPRAARSRPRKG